MNRSRPKGRDFFDVLFLMGKTKPNYSYLDLKLGIKNARQLKSAILERCDGIDLDGMAKDVAPFLFNPDDQKRIRLFTQFIEQENW